MLFSECLCEDAVHVLHRAHYYIQCLAFISVFDINMFIRFNRGFYVAIHECGFVLMLDQMCSIK